MAARGICRQCGASFQLYSTFSEQAHDCDCGANTDQPKYDRRAPLPDDYEPDNDQLEERRR